MLCPKGVPVWEALSPLGLYFNSILLREGIANGNWRCLLFAGPRPECDEQSVFRGLADEHEHAIRENGEFGDGENTSFKNRWTLVELGSLIFKQNFL